MAKTKGMPQLTPMAENLMNNAEAKTGPIYHNPDFGSFSPGQRSGVSLDEPFYHTGKTLRDVMNEAGHTADYHESLPTYAGDMTRADPRSVTHPMPVSLPVARPVVNRSNTDNGGPIAKGLAMGMGIGHASRRGHLLEAIELAGLHEHAGNNEKIIKNLVDK